MEQFTRAHAQWTSRTRYSDTSSYIYKIDYELQDHETAVAWAYNMVDALRRYSYDADCELFLLILEKELALEVLSDQM